jgi:hypothetical protein
MAAREGIWIDCFVTPLHGSRLRKANRASSLSERPALVLYHLLSVVNFDAPAFQKGAQFGQVLMVAGFDRAKHVHY